jgi:cellobiose-specific phosphotransferase system component IIB
MAKDADVILLAPQVHSSLGEVKIKCPNVKVSAIDAKLYSVLDAVGILDLAQKTAGDY